MIRQKRLDIFAYNIYALRTKQGITQTQLAKKLDCSNTLISQWENARTAPRFDDLFSLAEIFSCDIASLLKEPTWMQKQLRS